jgi:LTXXQ motif family protein
MEKPMPKKWIAVALALPFLWCPAAFAQDSSRGDGEHNWKNRSEWHQMRCTERYARKAAHIAYLEAKLALTEPQRSAWNKWRQTELDSAEQRRTACVQNQPKEGAKPTVLDREARIEKFLSTRLQQLQTSRPALQALYDALTPEQKVIFDQSTKWHRHHHHGEGEHHHGHGHGWGAGNHDRM